LIEIGARTYLAALSSPTSPHLARALYVLYAYAVFHGTGAGRALLDAALDPADRTALWVTDPNPRAQAFYRKHGFAPDGVAQVEDGVREIRMVRGMRPRRALAPGRPRPARPRRPSEQQHGSDRAHSLHELRPSKFFRAIHCPIRGRRVQGGPRWAHSRDRVRGQTALSRTGPHLCVPDGCGHTAIVGERVTTRQAKQ
jgi:Acetyltransferase (GNAT) domain